INDVCAISEPEHSDRSLDGPPHHGALHSSPTRRSSDLGISIPQGAQSITIGADGTVSVQIAGQSAPTQVGTLQLTDFVNPAGLQPRGENLFVESAASGPAQTSTPGLNGLGLLQQGFLEGSNVNVVEELVAMIETQRAYEMNSKAIATTDQMLQYVSNNL